MGQTVAHDEEESGAGELEIAGGDRLGLGWSCLLIAYSPALVFCLDGDRVKLLIKLLKNRE